MWQPYDIWYMKTVCKRPNRKVIIGREGAKWSIESTTILRYFPSRETARYQLSPGNIIHYQLLGKLLK